MTDAWGEGASIAVTVKRSLGERMFQTIRSWHGLSWGMGVLALFPGLAIQACGSSTDPPPGDETADLQMVLATVAADTVEMRDTLHLELLDQDGQPIPGANIEFTQRSDDGTAIQTLVVARLADDPMPPFTTNAEGQLSVDIYRGPTAGPVWLHAAAPAHSVRDSIRLEILPGAPDDIQLLPADTAVVVGRSYDLAATVVDRFGNDRPEPTAFVAESTNVVVSANAEGASITGQETGRASVSVTGGGLMMRGWVSVVPAGVLAAHVAALTTADSLFVITSETDGSAYEVHYRSEWVVNRDWYMDWMPGAAELVLAIGFTDHRPDLYRLPLPGSLEPFFADDPGGDAEFLPRSGHDGWIYFSLMLPPDAEVEIWRVREDGSGPERVGLEASPSERDYYPDLAPDGRRLVFSTNRGSPSGSITRIATLDLEAPTTEYAYLGVEGSSPVWSPSGDRIAYTDLDNALAVMAADGTAPSVISQPGRAYEAWIDWSPDGEWIVAAGEHGADLVNAETGETLPLAFSSRWRKPAWKP